MECTTNWLCRPDRTAEPDKYTPLELKHVRDLRACLLIMVTLIVLLLLVAELLLMHRLQWDKHTRRGLHPAHGESETFYYRAWRVQPSKQMILASGAPVCAGNTQPITPVGTSMAAFSARPTARSATCSATLWRGSVSPTAGFVSSTLATTWTSKVVKSVHGSRSRGKGA